MRAAEVIAALSLATDLGMGLPFEHGLHSTLAAMRLGERLGVDSETASLTYYGCLLFYVGCTADAEIAADLFDDEALVRHFTPVMFGSRAQTMAGIARALAPSEMRMPRRALHAAGRLPRAVRGYQSHVVALCEVARMLTDRLGLPPSVQDLFAHGTERWDGKGEPARLKGEELPLPLRIVHVARDAAFQRLLGGEDFAARVVAERAGHAFDPAIAALLAAEARQILALDTTGSAWDETLAREPSPQLILKGEQIERALAAMGDFADLLSPYLVGHSAGVAELATAAARRRSFPTADLVALRRAAHVHDLGRVAVPARIWQKAAPLTPDEWERVRLHGYHSERVLCRSPFLAALAPVATSHHERLDGTGYHRGPTGKRVGQAPEAQEASGPGQKKAPRPGISVHEILYGQPQIGNPLHFVDKDQAVVADEPHRILYGCCPGHRVVKEARYAVGSLPEDDLGERALANLPRTVDYDHSGVG